MKIQLRTFLGNARVPYLSLGKLNTNISIMSFVVLFLMSSANAFAINYTLNGTWSVPANWSGGSVPTLVSGDVVTINGNSIIDVNVTVPTGVQVNLSGGSAGNTTAFTLNTGQTLTINGGLRNFQAVPIEINGTLIVNSTSPQVFILNNTSIININNTGILNQIGASSEYEGDINNNGIIDVASGGVFRFNPNTGNPATQFNNNGTIKGEGTIEATNRPILNNAGGIIAPGSSAGCLAIQKLTNNGTIQVEVNGTTACTDYDKITSSGGVTLGGPLDVSINYIGSFGDVITFIDAASISGTFASNNVPADWTLKYNFPNTGEVSIEKTSGTDYTLNGTWSNPANWTPSYPGTTIGAGDAVYMDGDVTAVSNSRSTIDVDVTMAAGSFFNVKYLKGLSINAGVTLTVNGKYANTTGVSTELYGTYIANNANNGVDEIGFNNGSSLNIYSGGSLIQTGAGTFNFTGQLNNSGTIDIAAGSTFNNLGNGHIANSGIVKGGGVIANYVVNLAGGTVAPGTSPGCMSIGQFINSAGTLEIEVDGSTACTGYDKVTVTTFNLNLTGGILDINVNYTPTLGDVITFLDGTSITGTFASNNVPAGWELKYNFPNTGEVSIEFSGIANALHFDGINDEIFISNNTPFNIAGTEDLLITASIKVNSGSVSDPLFSNMDVGGTVRGYQIWVDGNGKLNLEWSASGGNRTLSSTTSINDGLCHDIKVEVIRSTGTANLYVDGTLETTETNPPMFGITSYASASPTNVYIGSERTNSSSFLWNGEIEDLQVTIGGTLQGSWNFNQGVAGGANAGLTTLTDNSGQGNHGTLQNFALTGATSNWITSTCNTPTAPTSFATGFNASAICSDATEWLVPIDVGTISSDLGAVSLVMNYDNTKLTYNSIHSAHANLNTGANPIQINDNNGKITISWASASGATISNETLMTLKFVPANSAANFSAIAGSTTSFSWDETVAGNCEFADNLATVLNTTFNAQLTATINGLPTAGLTSNKTNNEICIGDAITFTGTGGTSYEFFVNNVSQGAASATATFSSTLLVNGDKVKVKVTNASGCVATSSEITVTVNALPATTLTSNDADSKVCTGQVVTFTAASTDANEFIFYVNGTVAQAQSTTATYDYTAGTNGDVISVVGVKTATGCQQASTTTFTMDVSGCYNVSGNLVYKNAAETPMGNVVITITGTGVNKTVTTNVADGAFTITDLFDTETYTFSYATTKSHGGINSTDALLALLHSVGITSLTGLNAKAGDVNADNSVTTADALQTQLRFVKTISSFVAGDWVFQAGSYTPNGADITGQKLYALATGDMNGSYTPNSAENDEVTVSSINAGQLTVNDGDRIQIPITIKNGQDVGAMSLSMFFSSNAMTIHNVTLADGTSLLHNVNGNELRMAWADISSKIFADDDVLYYIDATINDVAAYTSAPFGVNAASELADGTGKVIDEVILGVPTITGTITNTNAIEIAATSVRSFPNPFNAQMTIEYDLPSTSKVQIQLFNSLGQELKTLVSETQSEGTHRAIWTADNQAAGVYYYSITVTEGNNRYKQTKQVILVK